MNINEILEEFANAKKVARVEHKKAIASTNSGPLKSLYHDRAVYKEGLIEATFKNRKAALRAEEVKDFPEKLKETEKAISEMEAAILKDMEA